MSSVSFASCGGIAALKDCEMHTYKGSKKIQCLWYTINQRVSSPDDSCIAFSSTQRPQQGDEQHELNNISSPSQSKIKASTFSTKACLSCSEALLAAQALTVICVF